MAENNDGLRYQKPPADLDMPTKMEHEDGPFAAHKKSERHHSKKSPAEPSLENANRPKTQPSDPEASSPSDHHDPPPPHIHHGHKNQHRHHHHNKKKEKQSTALEDHNKVVEDEKKEASPPQQSDERKPPKVCQLPLPETTNSPAALIATAQPFPEALDEEAAFDGGDLLPNEKPQGPKEVVATSNWKRQRAFLIGLCVILAILTCCGWITAAVWKQQQKPNSTPPLPSTPQFLFGYKMEEILPLRKLELTPNDLHDTPRLPTEIGLLTALTLLEMYNFQSLMGTLPTEIGELTAMRFLSIGANGLTGTIPSEIGRLTNLVALTITTEHHITGLIPSTIGLLTNLVHLDLRWNNLFGQVPSELGSLTKLTTMELEGNHPNLGLQRIRTRPPEITCPHMPPPPQEDDWQCDQRCPCCAPGWDGHERFNTIVHEFNSNTEESSCNYGANGDEIQLWVCDEHYNYNMALMSYRYDDDYDDDDMHYCAAGPDMMPISSRAEAEACWCVLDGKIKEVGAECHGLSLPTGCYGQ